MMIKGICVLLCVCIFHYGSAYNSKWTTCGRRILKDGQIFFIRGVNYAPVPIGESSGQDFLAKPDIYNRDLAIIRSLNANAIKVYSYDVNLDHKPFLDTSFHNSKPIYTLFSIWIPPHLFMDNIDINNDAFQKYVGQYQMMAEQTGNHPGTMGYSVAGEVNFDPHAKSELFWRKFNLISAAIRHGLAARNSHKLVTTNFLNDKAESFKTGERFNAAIDVWGLNVYETNYPKDLLPVYKQKIPIKPLLFSEYGIPFASNSKEADSAQSEHISHLIFTYAKQLEENFSSGKDAVVVGGFIFEYTDEWWKMNNWLKHDYGWQYNDRFPLKYDSEEWFGMFSIAKGSTLDVLRPRPVVSKITSLWSKKMPLEGTTLTKSCSNPNQASPKYTPEPTKSAPAPTPSNHNCKVSTGDKNAGLDAVYDSTCKNGGHGCHKNHCRFCKMFDTDASRTYAPCPTMIKRACSTDTYLCPDKSYVARDPKKKCQFKSCPRVQPATTAPPVYENNQKDCDPGEGNKQVGILMFYDKNCVKLLQGCDAGRIGCRYCATESSKYSHSYIACPKTKKTNLPAGKIPTIKCFTSEGNRQIGIDMYYDLSCLRGGMGCDTSMPGCRYCKFKDTKQSSHLFQCPSDKYSTKFSTTHKNTSKKTAVVTGVVAVIVLAIVGVIVVVIVWKRQINQQHILASPNLASVL